MTGKGRQVGSCIYILLFQKYRRLLLSWRDNDDDDVFESHLSYSPSLCAGWMCQLCAVDRAVEPHPPLHLWNRGVPAYLHVHQQRLESRGEHKDVYSSQSGIYWRKKNPSAAGLESVVLLNISGLQTGTPICLWFPLAPMWRFSDLFLCTLSLCRITCFGWSLGMWIQGRENVPMIPNRRTLQFWSVRRVIYWQKDQSNSYRIQKPHVSVRPLSHICRW